MTAIAVHPTTGSIVVGGHTTGAFPGEQNTGSYDGFVAMLNASDGAQLWLHQLDTGGGDYVNAIAVHPATGSIVVGGYTYRAFRGEQSSGNTDGFVAMFGASDGAQLWLNQFGSAGTEYLSAIAVCPTTGSIVVGGSTTGTFPGEQNTGGRDGVVAMLNASNGAQLWLHQFGTAGTEYLTAIAVHPTTGGIVVGGSTTGTFPGEQNTGSYDGVVAMLNASDGAQLWLHQFGTAGSDYVNAIAVHPTTGSIVVGGFTGSTFPGEQSGGCNDGFIAMYDCITVTSPPTTSASTSAPTSAPTASNPTTPAPTSSPPTTSPPTSNPTTPAPTTSNLTPNPTTSAATTSNPTTSNPTASAPTPAAPPPHSPTDSNAAVNPSGAEGQPSEDKSFGGNIPIIVGAVAAAVLCLLLFGHRRQRRSGRNADPELDDWNERQRAGLLDVINPVYRHKTALAAPAGFADAVARTALPAAVTTVRAEYGSLAAAGRPAPVSASGAVYQALDRGSGPAPADQLQPE